MAKTKQGIHSFIIKLTAAFFYIMAAASILFVAYAEFHPRLVVPTDAKLAYAGLITFALILASRLAISVCRTTKQKRKVSHLCAGVLFLYYALILANMLFFDAYFNRGGITGDWRHFYEPDVNLRPFDTIKLYINSYKQETLNNSVILTNLLGNLLAFAPMGFFLPVLFRSMKKILLFIFVVLVMVVSVEGLQLLTKVGSCDVDDVILNFTGAFVTFLLLKLPPLRRLMYKMYLN